MQDKSIQLTAVGPACGAAVATTLIDEERRTLESEITSLRDQLANRDRQIEGLRFNYQQFVDQNEEVNKIQRFVTANFADDIAEGYIPNLKFGDRTIAILLRLMKRQSLWRRMLRK